MRRIRRCLTMSSVRFNSQKLRAKHPRRLACEGIREMITGVERGKQAGSRPSGKRPRAGILVEGGQASLHCRRTTRSISARQTLGGRYSRRRTVEGCFSRLGSLVGGVDVRALFADCE